MRWTQTLIATLREPPAEAFDPLDFRVEQHDLTENVDDPGEQDPENDTVDGGVAEKRREERPVQGEGEGRHQNQEQRHPQQELARAPHAALFEQPRRHLALGCGHYRITTKSPASRAAAAQRRGRRVHAK